MPCGSMTKRITTWRTGTYYERIEAIIMPPPSETRRETYADGVFIDDSATMREVIKIAFRRENINVITCADAASALAQFEQHRPDVVITDVIMPDQDGYSVCSQIKQHPEFGGIPWC